MAITGGLLFGQVCVFIAGAPFALQDGFDLTPTEYTYAFATVTIVMFSANAINRTLLKRFASISLLRYGLSQAIFAAVFMTTMNIFGLHTLVTAIIGFALSISAMGFCMANMLGLAMRDHAARAGTAAGLIGFTNSLGGAIAAPLTSVIFGLDVVGVTLFMSILLVTAASVGLIGTRHEKAPAHA
jgi:DHA1 family bicyclomycin/chloramphenicol resistance-like MFS transporter